MISVKPWLYQGASGLRLRSPTDPDFLIIILFIYFRFLSLLLLSDRVWSETVYAIIGKIMLSITSSLPAWITDGGEVYQK